MCVCGGCERVKNVHKTPKTKEKVTFEKKRRRKIWTVQKVSCPDFRKSDKEEKKETIALYEYPEYICIFFSFLFDKNKNEFVPNDEGT